MGKRIQWLKQDMIDQINNGTFDYVILFTPTKSKDKQDISMNADEVIAKYRKIEKKRKEQLKGGKVGFACPGSVEKELLKLRQRDQL